MTSVHQEGDSDGDVVIIGTDLSVVLGVCVDVMEQHVITIDIDGL